MATTAAPAPIGTHAGASYGHGEPTGIWSWLTTVDHKRIGTLYLWTALTFFLVGGIEALIMRMQLMGPNGQLVSAEVFNQLFTMHGTTMVFLAIMPLSAAFFNYLIPLQIGARDVAFPRLNAFSYWVYLFGGIFMTVPIFFSAAPNAGWFGYAPLTTMQFSGGLNIDFWVIGLQILGISSLAAAFNFITTIINMRAPGMTLMRMPIFTWMSFVVQFLLILAFPAITVALVFLLFDRFFGTQFYELAAGADPLLWQHLFWVFGHPEVYILILPAFGLASEILPTFSKKPLFGYNVMVYSGIMIGFLGFGVWAHHMFAVGMGATADTIFAMATLLIGIPTGVKIFNWIATMWGGQLRFVTAMKFAVAMVALFTIGGISGVMHASPPTDLQQTDTYFIVAHFHYVLFGGSIMGIMGGIYFYFPKMTGRYLSEKLGSLHFWFFFIGMNVTFFPMHYSGMLGMPRRIYTYDAGQGWDQFNWWSTIGTILMFVGAIFFIINFFKSRKAGAIAPNDAWGAGTLEWSIPSPPPDYNFAQLPVVTSRYPLWDLKHPEMTADIAHSAPDEMTITDSHAVPMHEETEYKTAKELGIPMPFPTIKPLFAALFLVVMFSGLIFIHVGMFALAMTITIGGAALFVGTLYGWLTSPLE
ncbi:MAG: cytochrome c oxidase subunit I [Gemmatimonadetes bacterium]|nr:cytochrome c oxidase subunit I [Gemmatimonadota bacterium]